MCFLRRRICILKDPVEAIAFVVVISAVITSFCDSGESNLGVLITLALVILVSVASFSFRRALRILLFWGCFQELLSV